MTFEIHLGLPEIGDYWDSLCEKKNTGTIAPLEEAIWKKWGSAMGHLHLDPFYPGLRSHEIDGLTSRYGRKVFQSYLENHNPRAMRMYWVYGPGKGEITIIGLEPHPEDKKNGAYDRIKLSSLPPKTIK
jgi:hypothetical protein